MKAEDKEKIFASVKPPPKTSLGCLVPDHGSAYLPRNGFQHFKKYPGYGKKATFY
ncbi:hypothetical protein [Larkinella insperata]|uniref:hypothetical protein n=1 Tax=Larkinella insperata TaxID=332158 RepID=UPI0036D41072